MRQQIAFFFIALLVMTIFAREKVGPKTKFVFLIFTVALLFSHYATMYFFVLLLAIMWMASVIFRKTEFGENAAIIGEITENHPGKSIIETSIGGQRIMDMLSGEQLPRIC